MNKMNNTRKSRGKQDDKWLHEVGELIFIAIQIKGVHEKNTIYIRDGKHKKVERTKREVDPERRDIALPFSG